MMNNPKLCGLFALGAGFLLAGSAHATVIADWRFEPGALTVDSSGNGYDLTSSAAGATTSNDVPAGIGSTGSALFSGTGYHTVKDLDLSSYRHIQLSWYQKYVGSGNIIFETTTNFNASPGALIADTHEESATTGETGLNVVSNSSWHLDRFVHDAGANPIWDQFIVDINLDAAAPADVVQVFRNGVLQPDDAAYGQHAAIPVGLNFLNATGYVGARNDTIAGYQGYLDNMKIESVPEPTTAGALIAGIVTLMRRRRR